MEVLNVSPLSRDFMGVTGVGVLGMFCEGRGGGGDLYRGLGFGLLRGLLELLGEVFALETLDAIVRSLSSFGIGGTGGTPFCPGSTIKDFRREALAASRKTVLGEG